MTHGWYDINRDWGENVAKGPAWNGEFPPIPKLNKKYSLLGLSLNSPFGIPACPLTATAASVGVASRLGYDLLTFKTVRTIQWPGNKFPHWRHLSVPKGTDLRTSPGPFTADTKKFEDGETSMANSFGIHSLAPKRWQKEFEKAQKSLRPGQILILSMLPTRIEGKSLVEEAKDLGKLASDTSAKIIEINLSCPNTDTGKGLIQDDVEASIRLCRALKKAIGGRSLLAKVGFYHQEDDLRRFLQETKGIISGLSTMNTAAGTIVNPDGTETFPSRPIAGISGAAIRDMAMEQAEKVVKFRKKLKLKNFVIIGIGGVTKPEHIEAYLAIGVDAVQSAVGVYADPYLAIKYKKSQL